MNQPETVRKRLLTLFVVAAAASVLVAWILVTIFNRKQEARQPYVRVVEVTEISTDPQPWGLNWPRQYEGYLATAGDECRGGSSALPESKLDRQPWLRRLYAGYAFSLDCREARGHAYMLYDQSVTERVTQRPQAGACLHCHASATAMYRRVGLGAMGLPAGEEQLADVFEAQRKAMWRLDYISSENSRGFHADQKSARILGESIDYSRQAQALALRLRAPAAPNTQNLPKTPVVGISEGAGPTE